MKVVYAGLDQFVIRFMNNNDPVDTTYYVDSYELFTEEVEYPIFSCKVHDDNGNYGEINYSFSALYVSCIPKGVVEANTQYCYFYPISEEEAEELQDKYENIN